MTGQVEFDVPSADSPADPIPSGIDPTELEITLKVLAQLHEVDPEHPDYSTVMKEVRVKKRDLDLNDKVAALKVAEIDLQDLLDEVSLLIGKTVSESVKVPVSNPFFESDSACGGSCGTGGGCSCSA